MPDSAIIEAAAKAIFECAQDRFSTKTRTWDQLTEYRRSAYKAEAKAAIEAAEQAGAWTNHQSSGIA